MLNRAPYVGSWRTRESCEMSSGLTFTLPYCQEIDSRELASESYTLYAGHEIIQGLLL
jgi:hypothetical protein